MQTKIIPFRKYISNQNQEDNSDDFIILKASLAKIFESLIDFSNTIEEISEIILNEVQLITKSRYGYVSIIDSKTGDNTSFAATPMLEDNNQYFELDKNTIILRERNKKYPSLRGFSLNTKKSFYTNNPEKHPALTSLPHGHIPITNFLSVPVLINKELVGQITIANSTRPYTINDLKNVEILSNYYSLSLERKISRKKIEEEAEKYKELFKNISTCVVVLESIDNGENFIIVDINKAAEQLEKVQKQNIITKSVVEVFPGIKEFGLLEVFKRVSRTGIPENHPLNFYKDESRSGWRTNYIYKLASGEIVAVYDDITEKKTAEEKLEKASFYNRALIEASLDPLATINPDGKISDVNKATEKVTGLRRKELVGKDFSDFFTDPDKAKDGYKQVLALGLVRDFPLTIKHFSGKTTDVLYNATVYNDESGEVQGVFASARDITEIKKAEEEIINLSRFPDENPNPVIRIDYDGRILYLNYACKLMPYWNKKIGDIIDEGMMEKVRKSIKSHFYYNFTIQSNSNIYSFSISEIKEHKYINLYGMDITDKIRTKQELTESEGIYKSLFENSIVGIYQATPEGRYIDVNPALVEILGYNCREELLEVNITEQIYVSSGDRPGPDNREKPFIRQLKKKDGSLIWAEINSKVFYDNDNKPKYYQGIIRDISDKIISEEKLKQSYQKIRKNFNGVINTLSSIVEIKDPYTAGHQERVSKLTVAIAKVLGLGEEKINAIAIAALIHDIGKIGVPASILSKPTILSEIEFLMVKEHSQLGYNMLKDIDFSYPVAEIILQHHEKLDGSGYPGGLKDENIMFEAKIIAVADTIESMASHRPYRPALGLDKALKELEDGRGILYDKSIVDACIKIFKEKKFKF